MEGARLSSPVALSEQEEMIMSLFAKGLGNGEVAERMGISENTVKTYVRRAMAKLGAKTRSQAMAEWISRKLDISM
nr:helix-turn-helix transcriptional regulator [Bifidobacterium vespertilionis]